MTLPAFAYISPGILYGFTLTNAIYKIICIDEAVAIEYSSTVFKSSSSIGLGGGVILTIVIGSSL